MTELASQPDTAPSVWQSAVTLMTVAAICTALVAMTYYGTRQQIADNEQAWLEQSLKPAISGVPYEGDLTSDPLVISAPNELPGAGDAVVYRVQSGGNVVAALFVVTATDGFVGPIRLLIGLQDDGTLTGVRILEHKETPGIGDLVDQSRSDWVEQFVERSLGSPPVELWAIQRDGGEFDQVTGASITPRAIVKAIRETLVYFEAHRESILTLPSTGEAVTPE
ncbi:MAG: electron transport complex subunit RsxG [Gammaproteobacteria bacterium]|nr:electron transport complex subunit RsxG [Gammaproteobacteria bacterium]